MKNKRAAGWLTPPARTTTQQVEAYRKLERHLDIYRRVQVLGFDERAGMEFERLQRSRIRIGTMDLKIAAIALAHDATVLTRNSKDFSRVPNLRVEDWTA
jgi:tRNA(fMet)-specific endonuclease VapC